MEIDQNITFEERKALAMEGRRKGYNCAQAVVAAFPDVLHLPMETALRLSLGFGNGFGGMQHVCGVMSAMTLLEGVRFEDHSMARAGVYKVVRSLGDNFKEAFGSLQCCDIKSLDPPVPCNEVITRGIRIYHDFLEKQ